MALADFDALRTAITSPAQVLRQHKAVPTAVGLALRYTSLWTRGLDDTASTPSTAVAPDNTTTGALKKSNGGSGRQYITNGAHRHTSGTDYKSKRLLIIDRLSHQGGLVANITTLQTTNLATAALTRYTSGVGVMAAIEVYSQLGGVATRFDVTYTNSAGTGSRVGVYNAVAGELPLSGLFLPIGLVTGDLGVKSVESVQLSADTGTAGNFGVTLFKVLGFVTVPAASGDWDILSNAMWNEEILDDACLQIVSWGAVGVIELTNMLSLSEC